MGSTPRPGDAAAAVPGPRPGAGMRAAPAAGGSRRKVTPAEFKGLLPCGGAVPHIWKTRPEVFQSGICLRLDGKAFNILR